MLKLCGAVVTLFACILSWGSLMQSMQYGLVVPFSPAEFH